MAILFWIFFDQICPKWIKMDQTWSNWISHKSNNVSIESFYIYKKDKNVCLILDFVGSDLYKMDQTWSNWILIYEQNFTSVPIDPCSQNSTTEVMLKPMFLLCARVQMLGKLPIELKGFAVENIGKRIWKSMNVKSVNIL